MPSSVTPGVSNDDKVDIEHLLLEELLTSEEDDHGDSRRKKMKTGDGDIEGYGTVAASSPVPAYCPPHPGYMAGICIRCGMTKEDAEKNVSSTSQLEEEEESLPDKDAGVNRHLSLNYIHHSLEVSKAEAERLRRKTVKKALDAKKLLLVLDLDHTLLHSTRMTDVTEEQTAVLHEMLQKQPMDAPMVFHLGHMNMWTKFRPGIREFLEKAHRNFDLHVFTMGDKSYAAEMARLLDPSGKLFGGRVASSSDANDSMMKDLDVLLGSDDMMVILDDTVGVWPKHKANVIQMKRYLFFPACAAKFGSEGKSYLEVGGDEDIDDGGLGSALDVLEKSHRLFFNWLPEYGTPDIRRCLSLLRADILKDCCILFTRIIPKGVQQEQHGAWILATQMGATCVHDVSNRVTHVVAGGPTSKSEWGYKRDKFVVTVEWLYSCGFSWKRVNESLFQNILQASQDMNQNQLLENEQDAAKTARLAAGSSGCL
jgi:RNA polymerase II C-terminal domain phosphatase-like 3/4